MNNKIMENKEPKKIDGWNQVKDSGKREDFKTGSKRDSRIGKGRFDLLPFYAIQRLARVYENGAVKYGDNNWRLGQPCSRYLDSAMRHLFKAGSGWKDEDHFAQAMWNIAAIIETQKMIELNKASKELDDLCEFVPIWEEGNKI
jgi:hypothetical protein